MGLRELSSLRFAEGVQTHRISSGGASAFGFSLRFRDFGAASSPFFWPSPELQICLETFAKVTGRAFNFSTLLSLLNGILALGAKVAQIRVVKLGALRLQKNP